mmetsp:Transcript_10739/g.33121  ORF Transcript_10739/g.33121 Transcript_10739/m.33121 type:complete len:243 (+) Transcript_10739:375-1103(+)
MLPFRRLAVAISPSRPSCRAVGRPRIVDDHIHDHHERIVARSSILSELPSSCNAYQTDLRCALEISACRSKHTNCHERSSAAFAICDGRFGGLISRGTTDTSKPKLPSVFVDQLCTNGRGCAPIPSEPHLVEYLIHLAARERKSRTRCAGKVRHHYLIACQYAAQRQRRESRVVHLGVRDCIEVDHFAVHIPQCTTSLFQYHTKGRQNRGWRIVTLHFAFSPAEESAWRCNMDVAFGSKEAQ